MTPELWVDIQDLLSLVFYPVMLGYYMIGLAAALLVAVAALLIGSITKNL